ncbi:MAG: hypothetical protein U0Z44_07060 [Kouleothrix sp.]
MAIVWVEPGEHSVFAALEAVERAVERHEQAARLDERFMGDAYLAENIGQMRASWSLDLWRVVARRSALGRALTGPARGAQADLVVRPAAAAAGQRSFTARRYAAPTRSSPTCTT